MVQHHDDRGGSSITRRSLVQRLTAAGFSAPVIASILAREAGAQEATPAASPEATPVLAAEPGVDFREAFDLDERMIQYNPLNYGTPLEALEGEFLVPNDLFFIRTHAPIPDIDPGEWRLNVTGAVDTPLELSLDDLKGMEVSTFTAFLECSGNSRSFFEPNASGTPWGNTAIGNAEWTGTPLAPILEQAGVQDAAVDVVLQGGDFADMKRAIPIGEALESTTMVVWEMNGEELPQVHGGPVRLLVPGWGGISSIKWLVGVDVIDHVFDGHYNTDSYMIIDEFENRLRPVEEMPVKSVIALPVDGADLEAGQHTITGYAWSGYGGITKVEVSTDGGFTWSEAGIVEEAGPLSWVKFETTWDAQPGRASLHARATDARTMTQPPSKEWNAKGYKYNAIFEVEVSVS